MGAKSLLYNEEFVVFKLVSVKSLLKFKKLTSEF